MDVAGLVSFGATTAASSAGKAGIKAGVKVAAKSATKIATKQAGKSGLKTAIKLTAKGAKKAFCESIDKIVGKASAGHVCVFACFPAGTKINTAVGLKNIEDIKVGDKVWSYNELTGETGLQEIVRTMVRESDHTIELYTEEEIIETTAEHPFLTENGWKDAAELQTGDRIKSRNEEDVEIKDVKFSYKPRKVYNFEVSNWHTYFVGALQWLVHNAKKCLSKLPQQIHHFATNKSKKYTKQFEKIAKKFKLDLNGSWNKEALPHRGRHPYNYHEWVLKEMKDASKAAGKSQKKFLKLFEENVKKEVRENPDLLRKAGWE
ncbi:polymorphic toxin-type HINT domain-containing protein [Segatella oris]|uniref:polymorphic toxin-type HINT domain-containing protein n=1 Tax=Segatella oris TaxID=28135 RepID=UPI003610D868